MNAMHAITRQSPGARRGVAAIAVVLALVVAQLAVVAAVVCGVRDEDIAARRAETLRALYAAEAGVNMAVRELMLNTDEDGDGEIGSISDDGNDANDRQFTGANVVVTLDLSGSTRTLTSRGRSGEAVREISAVLAP